MLVAIGICLVMAFPLLVMIWLQELHRQWIESGEDRKIEYREPRWLPASPTVDELTWADDEVAQ